MFKVSACQGSIGRLRFARQGRRRSRPAAPGRTIVIGRFSPIGSRDGEIWAAPAVTPRLRGKRNAAAKAPCTPGWEFAGALPVPGCLSVSLAEPVFAALHELSADRSVSRCERIFRLPGLHWIETSPCVAAAGS